MDQDLDTRLREVEKKVDETHSMMKKIWKSYQITLWVTVALIVLPLIGLMFVLPSYLQSLDLNGVLK